MHVITIPERVYEEGYKTFIKLVSAGNGKNEVEINFEKVKYLTPLAILFLLIKVSEWTLNHQKVNFMNYESCTIFSYLQRFNFFEILEMKFEENFKRRDSAGKFVPIKSLKSCNIGDLSTEIAECIAPELVDEIDSNKTGFLNCIEYSISELGNNTVQHAECTSAFVCAQYNEVNDLIRVAIVDNGIGIKESFLRNNSPHNEYINTHLDAIHKALEPQTSSKIHLQLWGESQNAGVGLTLLKSISKKIGGTFVLFSGNGYFSLSDEEQFSDDLNFNGTLCSFTFKRADINNFNNLLFDIKKELRLIPIIEKNIEDLFK